MSLIVDYLVSSALFSSSQIIIISGFVFLLLSSFSSSFFFFFLSFFFFFFFFLLSSSFFLFFLLLSSSFFLFSFLLDYLCPFGKKENTFYHFAKIDYNYIKYINIEGKLIKIINSKLSNKHLFCRLIINQKKNCSF